MKKEGNILWKIICNKPEKQKSIVYTTCYYHHVFIYTICFPSQHNSWAEIISIFSGYSESSCSPMANEWQRGVCAINRKLQIHIPVPGSPIGTWFLLSLFLSISLLFLLFLWLLLWKMPFITYDRRWTLTLFCCMPCPQRLHVQILFAVTVEDCLEVTALPNEFPRVWALESGLDKATGQLEWHLKKTKPNNDNKNAARLLPSYFSCKRNKGSENRLIFDELVLFRGVLSF